MKNPATLLKTILTGAALVCLLSNISSAADSKPSLASSDCVKCHAAQPADIAANGGAHKSSVSCQDCHTGHRPVSKSNIPDCGMCHTDKSHYKLTGCLRCHSNPHTPKIIKLTNNITDECLTCHTGQIAKLKQTPSKHSKLACTFCHNVHGKIPLCTQCHKPHSSEMVVADCKRCHQAHMPTAVVYGSDTPNKMCGSCHKKPFEQHAKTDTKHKGVACVTCHKDKHKMVPACQSCHGTPHPATLMARFTKCGECHKIAHDLNRWDKAVEPPKEAVAPKKGSKKK